MNRALFLGSLALAFEAILFLAAFNYTSEHDRPQPRLAGDLGWSYSNRYWGLLLVVGVIIRLVDKDG